MLEKTKVLAYIHRDYNGKKEFLVFDHVDQPEAGTQIIGGTVEKGEDLREALLREIIEESGLVFHIVDVHSVGSSVYLRQDFPEKHLRQYYKIDGSHLEDEWVHTVDSNASDHGLLFRFYWLDLAQAKACLVGNMAEYIHLA